jgi:hypothetical protein
MKHVIRNLIILAFLAVSTYGAFSTSDDMTKSVYLVITILSCLMLVREQMRCRNENFSEEEMIDSIRKTPLTLPPPPVHLPQY